MARTTAVKQNGEKYFKSAGPGDDHHTKLAARIRYASPAIQLGGETVHALMLQT